MELSPADHVCLETLWGALPAYWVGQAAIVAMPETTERVSAVSAAAQRARVGVGPFGGGTGRVGGHGHGAGERGDRGGAWIARGGCALWRRHGSGWRASQRRRSGAVDSVA